MLSLHRGLFSVCLVAAHVALHQFLTATAALFLACVGNDNLVSWLLKLFTDPDRVSPGLHRYACPGAIRKPLLNGFWSSLETTSVHNFAILVEGAVRAPDISKIDTDRQLDLKLYTRDSATIAASSSSWETVSSFERTCSSHL